ncbi:hypothetical protein [Streptomyces sp. NPDC056661]|uniref:hypothetical protein n=1 Tax=Streptomyces sp. NPDC056661 TaxID=3345898 RepID=UPI003694F80F
MEPQIPKTADVEERLRSALAARSALVASGSLRPQSPAWPTRSAWRWQLRAVGAVAAAFLTVVTVVIFAYRPVEQERHRWAAASRRVDLRELSFQVPRGWTAWQPEPGIQACVQPPGVPQDMDHCWATGIQVATKTGDQSGILDRDDGWKAQPFCWTADGRANFTDAITSSRLVAQATVPVSGQQASYRAWRVTCRSGQKFTARLWWVPLHELSIRAYRLDSREAPLADRLVSSLTLR